MGLKSFFVAWEFLYIYIYISCDVYACVCIYIYYIHDDFYIVFFLWIRRIPIFAVPNLPRIVYIYIYVYIDCKSSMTDSLCSGYMIQDSRNQAFICTCICPQRATHILFDLYGMQPFSDITFWYRSDYCPKNSVGTGTPSIGVWKIILLSTFGMLRFQVGFQKCLPVYLICPIQVIV